MLMVQTRAQEDLYSSMPARFQSENHRVYLSTATLAKTLQGEQTMCRFYSGLEQRGLHYSKKWGSAVRRIGGSDIRQIGLGVWDILFVGSLRRNSNVVLTFTPTG